MNTVVMATANKGKLREIKHHLQHLLFNVVSQQELGIQSAAETGLTFVENAILKARHGAKKANMPAIADDSGLIVDALEGEPGIHSARYGGEDASDRDNITKLLRKLANVPDAKRQARFFCALVYLRYPKDPAPIICQGLWQGQIIFEPQGEDGFGYDPIFYLPDHNCTAAQLDLATKNSLSHRGQALQQMVAQLKTC